MSTMIDKYGSMSLAELEVCEEMLNGHGLFAMKLYVELQEVRRGHPPDRCTTALNPNRTCTLCELFDAGGLMTEVENAIAFFLDTKACLKEVRNMFGGSSTRLSDIRSRSVAIESTLAKAALYTTMVVGDTLHNHHTKWQARLQTAVLSTASRLDHHGHKTKSSSRSRKRLVSDSKPGAPSASSLQNMSTHETSDGRRYLVLEQCRGGCCPTLDDYAALSSSYGYGVNKIEAATDAKRVAFGSGTASKATDPSLLKHTHQPPPSLPQDRSSTEVKRASKVFPKSDATISTTAVHSAPGTTSKPTCPYSSQKLLITPEILVAIPPHPEHRISTHTHPCTGSEYDSAFSTPKPVRETSSLASETSVTTPTSSIPETETKTGISVASLPDPEPEDEEPIDDPRIHRLRDQIAKFNVSRRALMEWTVDTFTQIDEQRGRMSNQSRDAVPSEDSSRVGLPRLTDPDRTPRCDDEATHEDRFSFEDQERLKQYWQLAQKRQSKAQKRIRVGV